MEWYTWVEGEVDVCISGITASGPARLSDPRHLARDTGPRYGRTTGSQPRGAYSPHHPLGFRAPQQVAALAVANRFHFDKIWECPWHRKSVFFGICIRCSDKPGTIEQDSKGIRSCCRGSFLDLSSQLPSKRHKVFIPTGSFPCVSQLGKLQQRLPALPDNYYPSGSYVKNCYKQTVCNYIDLLPFSCLLQNLLHI